MTIWVRLNDLRALIIFNQFRDCSKSESKGVWSRKTRIKRVDLKLKIGKSVKLQHWNVQNSRKAIAVTNKTSNKT